MAPPNYCDVKTCTHLVNFGPVTSEITRVRRAVLPQLADPPSFGMLAFQNGLQYRNFDFSGLECQSILDIVQKFGELRSSDSGVYYVSTCIAGVDYFSGVSLSTFASGRHS